MAAAAAAAVAAYVSLIFLQIFLTSTLQLVVVGSLLLLLLLLFPCCCSWHNQKRSRRTITKISVQVHIACVRRGVKPVYPCSAAACSSCCPLPSPHRSTFRSLPSAAAVVVAASYGRVNGVFWLPVIDCCLSMQMCKDASTAATSASASASTPTATATRSCKSETG